MPTALSLSSKAELTPAKSSDDISRAPGPFSRPPRSTLSIACLGGDPYISQLFCRRGGWVMSQDSIFPALVNVRRCSGMCESSALSGTATLWSRRISALRGQRNFLDNSCSNAAATAHRPNIWGVSVDSADLGAVMPVKSSLRVATGRSGRHPTIGAYAELAFAPPLPTQCQPCRRNLARNTDGVHHEGLRRATPITRQLRVPVRSRHSTRRRHATSLITTIGADLDGTARLHAEIRHGAQNLCRPPRNTTRTLPRLLQPRKDGPASSCRGRCGG